MTLTRAVIPATIRPIGDIATSTFQAFQALATDAIIAGIGPRLLARFKTSSRPFLTTRIATSNAFTKGEITPTILSPLSRTHRENVSNNSVTAGMILTAMLVNKSLNDLVIRPMPSLKAPLISASSSAFSPSSSIRLLYSASSAVVSLVRTSSMVLSMPRR